MSQNPNSGCKNNQKKRKECTIIENIRYLCRKNHEKRKIRQLQTTMEGLFAVSILTLLWGLIFGVLVSAPMGPTGILVIQRTLNKGWIPGLFTGLGAVLSDLFYALLSTFAVSLVVDWIETNQIILLFTAGILIASYGVYLWRSNPASALNSKETPNTKLPLEVRTMTGMEALYDREYYAVTVMHKLYESRIFDDLRFTEGMIYEDAAIRAPLLWRSRRIAVTNPQTGLWGFVDYLGRWAIQPQFTDQVAFGDDNNYEYTQVKQEGRWGNINRDGEIISTFIFFTKEDAAYALRQYEHGRTLEGWRLPVSNPSDGKWGWVDWSGEWRIQPIYEDAPIYHNRWQG